MPKKKLLQTIEECNAELERLKEAGRSPRHAGKVRFRIVGSRTSGIYGYQCCARSSPNRSLGSGRSKRSSL